MTIASIIHFCTNDYRFLRKNVEEAKKISHKIVIPVCDHFFNGQPENRLLLDWIYREFSDCLFIEFAYDPIHLYSAFHSSYTSEHREWSRFWHSTSRLVGALFAPPDVDYLLFLDGDEILDGNRMKQWLDTKEYCLYTGVRFRCYFYSRPDRRSREIFDSALLVRQKELDYSNMIDSEERAGWYRGLAEPKKKDQLDGKGEPFLHHYCWVRTKEECLKKSVTWGHRLDKNWGPPIERLFQEKDPLEPMDLPLSFYDVEPFFDPLQVALPEIESKSASFPPNVLKVGKEEAFQQIFKSLLR